MPHVCCKEFSSSAAHSLRSLYPSFSVTFDDLFDSIFNPISSTQTLGIILIVFDQSSAPRLQRTHQLLNYGEHSWGGQTALLEKICTYSILIPWHKFTFLKFKDFCSRITSICLIGEKC
ncbi:hypothetical protein MKW98_016583 [Papaver atlanticum]|uniref:Uncharacterized protein n=1 Tax=Papaver atlanticum TaxID=357466 RepID=A0AAD4X8V8_9MAGN|nr:hypothetical protein MKW98_016583 [Papaver atlanticum]